MSELQDILFNSEEDPAETVRTSDENEINGQVMIQEAFDISYNAEETDTPAETPEDAIRESMDAVERMKNEIAAENESLNRRFEEHVARRSVPGERHRRPTYVIGILSGAASLIFMGLMLLISLVSSPIGVLSAIKLSPLILVFLGAEILFAIFRKKTLRIRIDIKSMIVIASLIVISAVLAVVSVTASAGKGERVYAEQRIKNMLASEIHDSIAKDNIRSVDIETQLFGENALIYETPADLTDGDIINLTVNFSDAQMTIRDFAKECRTILDGINELSYNFGSIMFIADDKVNHYVLDVDWHYQSDSSADKLAALVNYYGDDISDNDIPDLIDE